MGDLDDLNTLLWAGVIDEDEFRALEASRDTPMPAIPPRTTKSLPDHGNMPCPRCGGNTNPYKGRYAEKREAAIARSFGLCQVCGFHPAMETHHWAKPRHYPCGNCVTEDDLTAACRNCHDIATEIRSFQFFVEDTFVFGPMTAWTKGKPDGVLVIDYSEQTSTRRLDLDALQEWHLRQKQTELRNAGRPRPERKSTKDTVRVEIGLDVVIDAERSIVDRARILAGYEGMSIEEWLQSLVVASLGGERGAGPWLESLIEDALRED